MERTVVIGAQGLGVEYVLVQPRNGSILRAVIREKQRYESLPQFRGARSYDPRGIVIQIVVAGAQSLGAEFAFVELRSGSILRASIRER